MRLFSLLRSLDSIDLAIYATIFLLLFYIGFLGGKSIGKLDFFQGLTKKNYFEGAPAMIKNGQYNLLAIEVDRLSSPEPRLKGVWLLISLRETNSLTLIPLFPRVDSGSTILDPLLSQSFGITPQRFPDANFLEQLSQQIWWDNYLLIDEIGVTKVLETLNYEGENDLKFNISTTYDAIPPVWLDPDKALQGQVELLKETCNLISKLPGFKKINSTIQQADTHIITDLDQSGNLHQDISDHEDIYPLKCEFPTLTFDNP